MITSWVPRLVQVSVLCVMLGVAIAGASRAGEIRGVIVDESGRARMSPGMRAVQTSKNTARIFVGGGQGERGTVACVCKGQGSGCLLSILNDALFCKNTGCSDCRIESKPSQLIKTPQ